MMTEVANLVRHPLRRRFLLGLSIVLAQQLSGVTFFAIYSNDLFNRLSGKGKQATLAIAIAKVVGGGLAVVFMKNFGRKFNCLLGGAG